MSSLRTDTARVHLTVLGEDVLVETEVSVGPVTPTALLSPARAIGEAIAEVATRRAHRDGERVSCRAGCGACCRHLVPISVLEAAALVEAIASLPADRRARVERRFAEAVRRMEDLGLLDATAPSGRASLRSPAPPGTTAWEEASRRYFEAGIPCPLLEEECCSLYEHRPLVCREYLAVTPAERCQTWGPGVRTVARPVRMSEALGEVARGLGHGESPCIPLALALEWIETHGADLARTHDGAALFYSLVDAIQRQDSPA